MVIGGLEGTAKDRVLSSPAQFNRITYEQGDVILERALLFRPWRTIGGQGSAPQVKKHFESGIEQYLGNVVFDNFTTSTLGGFL